MLQRSSFRKIEHQHALESKRTKTKIVSVVADSSTSASTPVMPNGYRLKLQGRVDRHLLAELVAIPVFISIVMP